MRSEKEWLALIVEQHKTFIETIADVEFVIVNKSDKRELSKAVAAAIDRSTKIVEEAIYLLER